MKIKVISKIFSTLLALSFFGYGASKRSDRTVRQVHSDYDYLQSYYAARENHYRHYSDYPDCNDDYKYPSYYPYRRGYHHHNHNSNRNTWNRKRKTPQPRSPKPTRKTMTNRRTTLKSNPFRGGCGINYENRIVGGETTSPRNWRWIASLSRSNNQHICGGALISRQYVLTAAHCIDLSNTTDLKVRLGEYDFNRLDDGKAEDYNVAKLIKNPNYDRVGNKNDIGLIKLEKAATLSPSVTIACLPSRIDDYSGRNAVVIGWGRTSYQGSRSTVLQQVSVQIWNNTECSKAYAFSDPLPSYYLCAGTTTGQDSCSGDSGGPLMIQNKYGRWTIVGIVSWGFRCGEPDVPGVYTRVSTFINWIKGNIV